MKNLKKLFDANKKLIIKLSIVFLAGVSGAFAFAPYYIFPLLIISFCSLLYFLFHSESYKESFFIGWIFGCGYFCAGLYWISYPLIFYFLNSLWWLIPFAIILIPCVLALYHGVCALILHKCNNGNKIVFAICFLCVWVLCEFLRNNLFTGLPWLITGYSVMNWPILIQSASWFGVFGLSAMGLSVPVICFILIDAWANKKWSKAHIITCSVLISLFLINILYGWHRLHTASIQLSSHYKIKIIQPNINTRIRKSNMDKNAEEIIKLARFNPIEDHGLLYVLLPEGGLNHFKKSYLLKLIRSSIPPNSYLIGGGDRMDYARRLAWNSVLVINHAGTVIDAYDKTHLVPFGEYIPFQKDLPITMKAVVSSFTNHFLDFSPGAGPRTLMTSTKFPFNPSICYESLFSKNMIQKFSKKDKDKNPYPQLLINFTTDMWYKNSSGPYQHFDMSALRAVELGIPLIRVANTGISGIVDPYGRIFAKLALNKTGIISNYIPLALPFQTFYFIYRDTPILLLLSVIFSLAYFISQRKTR